MPSTEYRKKVRVITDSNKGEILVVVGGIGKRQVAKDNSLNCMEGEEFVKLIRPYI